MSRGEWADVAKAICSLRSEITNRTGPPPMALGAYEAQVRRGAQLEILDEICHRIAYEFGRRHRRFDHKLFLQLCGVTGTT